jgi:hypothetical protein
MLNSIWLRQPYEFLPLYAHEVSRNLNATARTLTTAQQVQSHSSQGMETMHERCFGD